MSDKPEVGTFSEPPEEEGAADGIILYQPGRQDAYEAAESEDESPAPRSRAPLWIGLVVVAVGGLGALQFLGGSSPTPEPPPVRPRPVTLQGAAQVIRPIGEIESSGPVGGIVGLGVTVLGRGGLPMADTLVVFERQSGGATIQATQVRTDSSGVARTMARLPDSPGSSLISVEVPGSSLPPLRLITTALSGAPARILVLEGSGQQVEVGEMVRDRPRIQVVDERGNPVAEARVDFDVGAGGGMVAPSRVRTDSEGMAATRWRLSLTEGEQLLEVRTPGVDAVARITATALPRRTTVQLDDPSTGVEVLPAVVREIPYVVGGSHVCSTSPEGTDCRGANDRGQALEHSDRAYAALSSGVSHVCALDAQGIASCWGANESGQLGDGGRLDLSAPTLVRTELRFESITAGVSHTCGLAGGGVPVCWGLNLSGQLGDGSRNDQRSPRTVGGGLEFQTLVAGWHHTCGTTGSESAFCWGSNNHGQLGDGSRLDRLVPTLVRGGSFQSLVAGNEHTCGISDGTAFCWGQNSSGQLGTGTTDGRAQPTEVVGLPGAPTMLAAGAVHTCALLGDGNAYCWGNNRGGQLGDGSNEGRLSPALVSGGHTFSAIYAGGALTCGITTAGAEYCWGLNQDQQIGDGTRVSRNQPTRVVQ